MSEPPGAGAIVPYTGPGLKSETTLAATTKTNTSKPSSSDALLAGLIFGAMLSGNSVSFHTTTTTNNKRPAPTKPAPSVKKQKTEVAWSTVPARKPIQAPVPKPGPVDAKPLRFRLLDALTLHDEDCISVRLRTVPAPGCSTPNWGMSTISVCVTPVKAARLLRVSATHQITCGCVPDAWPISLEYEYVRGTEKTPFFRLIIEASKKHHSDAEVKLRTLKQETRKGDKPVVLSYGNTCHGSNSSEGIAVSNYLTDSQWTVFVVAHLLVVPADFC